ncbi:hypothetical protein MPTK1_7g00300 [Marchantia polymorpha subsp. ruderalis]|uniref:Secreted protein n=2 Tax=Marchantia polymorpha TaxID=3197 RepID=A0AAF6BUP2_MARPO|nr:hypothetical protein MARPO_0046s0094 [Marchantia polymorpha]BBN15726.1 hypothetical protein Mp_7g00300 [Marchantia polymorpha subsp. ruderalis]|eukprot:PTQ39281.1 hypothetical protein MARPO_0046s0094 [Marchantia polymorpha]
MEGFGQSWLWLILCLSDHLPYRSVSCALSPVARKGRSQDSIAAVCRTVQPGDMLSVAVLRLCTKEMKIRAWKRMLRSNPIITSESRRMLWWLQ